MSDDQPEGQLLIYKDGALNLQVRMDGKTVWLTQAAMAELYQTSPQNITLHIKSIYDDGELEESATCKDYLQVRLEGSRQVSGNLRHYRMEAILAVGYSVPSHRSHWGVSIGVRSEYLTNWLALAPVVSWPGSLAGGHHSAAAAVGCP